MAWVKLPIFGSPLQNVDETELDVTNRILVDAYVDEAGFTVKRPGLTQYINFGTGQPVDGMYWWDNAQVFIVISGGRVFQINDIVGNYTELTGVTLATSTIFSFTTDGTRCYTAGGGSIVHFTESGTLTTMADADAPTAVRAVDFFDQYILALVKDTSNVNFSEPGNGLSWLGTDIINAENRPDSGQGLIASFGGFAIVGSETTELWINDGVSPFSRIQGATIDQGTIAPFSIAHTDKDTFWISDKRRLTHLQDFRPVETKFPYQRVIGDNFFIEDARGTIVELDGLTWYVLTFPSQDLTLAYDYKNNTWARWGTWGTDISDYRRFRMRTGAFAKRWNQYLIGDHTNGIIYKLSRSAYTDAGDIIRSSRRTGFISHDTSLYKRCKKLRVRCKVNVANGSVLNPVMTVRWRNGNGAWGTEHTIPLGPAGANELIGQLAPCGRYRVRQYEFTCSDAVEWILQGGEEEIEIMSR